jgi:TRAP-type C4-dicarboxylate transport system permease small subunit
MAALRNFAILALIALGITVLPGGDAALNVAVTLLTIFFFVAIAYFGYRLFMENRFTIETLDDRLRLVLYSSVGLAFLTFTATARLFDIGGVGVLTWLALLGLASFGVFWVYRRHREYG